jgi:hypothetical protein
MTDKLQTRPLVGEGAPHGEDSNFQTEETSGHEPQQGLDTKTDRLTDRQLQCDFDFKSVDFRDASLPAWEQRNLIEGVSVVGRIIEKRWQRESWHL